MISAKKRKKMLKPIDIETRDWLLNSLLRFTKCFYKERTGRSFDLSYPDGRESHYITICKSLTKVFLGETNR